MMRLFSSLWMLRDVWRFDTVIANRDINPERWTLFLERIIVKAGVRLVFDFDDAIYLGGRDQKLQKIMHWCYAVTPGNPTLEKYAVQYSNNVIIVPTVIDTEYYKPVQVRAQGKLRIGWSGSASTNKYCLPLVKDVIEKLSKEVDFDFIVISNEDPKLQWSGVQSTFIKWDEESEVEQLQYLDIGLMPLRDNEFEKGKCGLKAIQYMGVGIPIVVSKVGVNADIVKHGVSGFHCTTEEDWINTLKSLANDEGLRKRIGSAGRQNVEELYSIHFAIKKWEQILM
ncbi:MAG: glycosyltransferase [Cyclobacteriaceae bacterium]|nr:MAG: glycosyltransferase [Cyclobacteriaceae bacterium]